MEIKTTKEIWDICYPSPDYLTDKEYNKKWVSYDGLKEPLGYALYMHRQDAYLTCPETCWCWEVENLQLDND